MMEFAQPPPSSANFSVPPPPVQNTSPASTSHASTQGPSHGPSHGPPHERHGNHYNNHHRERHYHGGFSGGKGHYRSYNYQRNAAAVQDDFDGKRLRKSVMRKTVDYNSSIVRELEVKYYFSYIWTALIHAKTVFE